MVLGTLTLLLAGCDANIPPPSVALARDQTLKMLWLPGGSDITTLDPSQASDTGSIPIVNLLFDGLVTLDKHLNVEPWGASSWTISADGLTYTFRLRRGQHFSDGVPVKPSDYAWSIERTLNPCTGSPTSYYLVAITDATAFNGENCDKGTVAGSITTLIGDSILPNDGANTLTITLRQPSGYFLEALSYVTSYALERNVVTGPDLGRDGLWMDNLSKGATGQGGSGMFYLSAWDHHSHVILKPNPYWWGASAGRKIHFATSDFSLFGDATASYATYQSDQSIAYSDTIPAPQLAAAKTLPEYFAIPTIGTTGLELNWKIAPFDDVHARRAFCESINRNALNASVQKGTMVFNLAYRATRHARLQHETAWHRKHSGIG
jgi:oligopeptide transport system substrate-binding protein